MWISENSQGEYAHRFGGPPRHRGIVPPGQSYPIHLFYEFDLNDPVLPYHLPGIRWLPLYNAIRYTIPRSLPFQYRVISDEEIEIFNGEGWTFEEAFPYRDYPQIFPQLDCTLNPPERIAYDEYESDREEYLELRDLTPEEAEDPVLMMAMDAGIHSWTGPSKCHNPKCSRSNMLLLAAFSNEWLEDEKISIWGGEEDVIIVYQICATCGTIDVGNLVN